MTTIRRYNPEGIAVPASRYVHAVLTTDATRWLHLAGQIGIAPDGRVTEGLAAQIDQCLANIDAALVSAQMTRADVLKLTFYLTDSSPEAIATYRARRDVWLGDGPTPASTLLVVSALAFAALLVEVECIAAA